MAYKQIRDANWNIEYQGGWCLKAVQDAFDTDHISPTAMADWNNGLGVRYTSVPPLGITVPVYFSLGSEPAGHVAIRLDDGYVASSTLAGFHKPMYLHKNLDDLINMYAKYNGGCTFLGWKDTVGSKRVVQWIDEVSPEQVKQAYREILEREADADGLNHYLTNGMTLEQIRADLLASNEYRLIQEAKAAKKAQEEAQKAKEQAEAEQRAKEAEEARKQAEKEEAERQAEEARQKAEAEAEEKERKAREEAEKSQPEEPEIAEQPSKQNNVNTLNMLILLIKRIIIKLMEVFK